MKKETFEKAILINSEMEKMKRAVNELQGNTKGCAGMERVYVSDGGDELMLELRGVLLKHLSNKITSLQKQFNNIK